MKIDRVSNTFDIWKALLQDIDSTSSLIGSHQMNSRRMNISTPKVIHEPATPSRPYNRRLVFLLRDESDIFEVKRLNNLVNLFFIFATSDLCFLSNSDHEFLSSEKLGNLSQPNGLLEEDGLFSGFKSDPESSLLPSLAA
tara:strand:+ start:6482 stop:6901 length:420 start_codon:yes stop_codon:yes gene_type:complete